MKILAINGSAKKTGGINQTLIDALFEGARSKGAECETIRLSHVKINRCIACNFCQNSEGYTCVYHDKDDFESIITKIKAADLLFFSTPVYVFQMSSLLKSFFERIYGHGKSHIKEITKSGLFFHDVDPGLKNKPFVYAIVSDNLEKETTRSIKYFFQAYSKFMDAPIAGNIIRNSAFIFRDNEINDEYKIIKERALRAMSLAGTELVEKGVISQRIESEIAHSILPIPGFMFNLIKKTASGRKKLLEKINEK